MKTRGRVKEVAFEFPFRRMLWHENESACMKEEFDTAGDSYVRQKGGPTDCSNARKPSGQYQEVLKRVAALHREECFPENRIHSPPRPTGSRQCSSVPPPRRSRWSSTRVCRNQQNRGRPMRNSLALVDIMKSELLESGEYLHLEAAECGKAIDRLLKEKKLRFRDHNCSSRCSADFAASIRQQVYFLLERLDHLDNRAQALSESLEDLVEQRYREAALKVSQSHELFYPNGVKNHHVAKTKNSRKAFSGREMRAFNLPHHSTDHSIGRAEPRDRGGTAAGRKDRWQYSTESCTSATGEQSSLSDHSSVDSGLHSSESTSRVFATPPKIKSQQKKQKARWKTDHNGPLCDGFNGQSNTENEAAVAALYEPSASLEFKGRKGRKSPEAIPVKLQSAGNTDSKTPERSCEAISLPKISPTILSPQFSRAQSKTSVKTKIKPKGSKSSGLLTSPPAQHMQGVTTNVSEEHDLNRLRLSDLDLEVMLLNAQRAKHLREIERLHEALRSQRLIVQELSQTLDFERQLQRNAKSPNPFSLRQKCRGKDSRNVRLLRPGSRSSICKCRNRHAVAMQTEENRTKVDSSPSPTSDEPWCRLFPLTEANSQFYTSSTARRDSSSLGPFARARANTRSRAAVTLDYASEVEYFDVCYVFDQTHELDVIGENLCLNEIIAAVQEFEATFTPQKAKQIRRSNPLLQPQSVRRVLEKVCVVQRSTRSNDGKDGNAVFYCNTTSNEEDKTGGDTEDEIRHFAEPFAFSETNPEANATSSVSTTQPKSLVGETKSQLPNVENADLFQYIQDVVAPEIVSQGGVRRRRRKRKRRRRSVPNSVQDNEYPDDRSIQTTPGQAVSSPVVLSADRIHTSPAVLSPSATQQYHIVDVNSVGETFSSRPINGARKGARTSRHAQKEGTSEIIAPIALPFALEEPPQPRPHNNINDPDSADGEDEDELSADVMGSLRRARSTVLKDLADLSGPLTRRQLQAVMEYEFVSFLLALMCPIERSTKAGYNFYKVRLSETVARNVALRLDYTLQLDQTVVKSCYMRESPWFVAPYLEFDDEAEYEYPRGFEALKWTNRIWTRYDALSRRVELKSFDLNSSEISIFRAVDRIRLLSSVLKRHFHINVMVEQKLMGGWYCLHQPLTRRALHNNWANLRFKSLRATKQPLEDIRDYFGEDVSFYFAWLGFFTHRLWWPAVIGVIVWAVQLGFDPAGTFYAGPSNVASICFSLVVTVWAALFLQSWQKFENFLIVRWGRDRQGLKPLIERGEYKADKYVQDPADPKRLIKVALRWKQWTRRICSFCIVSLFLLTVLGTTAGLYSLAWFSRKHPEDFEWSMGQLAWFISLSNTAMITIYDYIWQYVAPALTDLENWKTDESYQRAYILKVFLFRTMNNFSNLFYVAFFKDYVDPALPREEGGSLPQLRLNLATQFVTRMLGNLTEVGWPYFVGWLRRYRIREEIELAALTRAESEFLLPQYNTFEGLMGEYMEILLNFAFVTVFSIVLPVIPLLVLILNSVELRSDGYKLNLARQNQEIRLSPPAILSPKFGPLFCLSVLLLHRKPLSPADSAMHGIGIWNSLLGGLSLLAIAVNVAMSLFVIGVGFGVDMPLWHKFLFFVLVEHAIVCVPSFLAIGNWDQGANLETLRRLMHSGMKECLWGDRGAESGLNSLKRMPSVKVASPTLSPGVGLMQMADQLDESMPRMNKRAAERRVSTDMASRNGNILNIVGANVGKNIARVGLWSRNPSRTSSIGRKMSAQSFTNIGAMKK